MNQEYTDYVDDEARQQSMSMQNEQDHREYGLNFNSVHHLFSHLYLFR